MAWVGKRGTKWFVRYRVTDSVGNEVMKRVSGFASEAEAWEQARALEQASNSGIDVNGDRKPIGYWVERWFSEHVVHATEQTTTARYNLAVDVLSTLPIWQEPVRNLSAQRYTQLLRFLLERKPGKRIAPATATSYADPIRLALSWATKAGHLPRNPIVGYTSLTIPRTTHRILSDQDIQDLTTASKEKGIRIALLLGLYCGLRLEEVAGLTWDAVDLPQRAIRIIEVRTKTIAGVEVIKGPKTDRSMRTVTLPDLLLKEFKSAKRVHRRVCVTPEGQPYTLAAMRRAVTRLAQGINAERAKDGKVAPMPLINFRDLRHTHAAFLIRLGVHPKVISERLGHTSIKVTMDTYGYLMTGMQYTAVDAIDKHMNSGASGRKSGRKGA